MPVAIIGMPRSGTSMVASILQACGLYLGPPAEIQWADRNNPRGYFENGRFPAIDAQLLSMIQAGFAAPPEPAAGWRETQTTRLERQACALAEEFGAAGTWGWKAPISSLTLPFWRRVYPDLATVVCVRHPAAVAQSMRDAWFLHERLNASLWLRYYRRILATMDRERSVVVSYEQMLLNPETEIRRVAEFAGLQYAGPERVARLVAPQLQHASGADGIRLGEGTREILRLYEEVLALGGYDVSAAAGPQHTSHSARRNVLSTATDLLVGRLLQGRPHTPAWTATLRASQVLVAVQDGHLAEGLRTLAGTSGLLAH